MGAALRTPHFCVLSAPPGSPSFLLSRGAGADIGSFTARGGSGFQPEVGGGSFALNCEVCVRIPLRSAVAAVHESCGPRWACCGAAEDVAHLSVLSTRELVGSLPAVFTVTCVACGLTAVRGPELLRVRGAVGSTWPSPARLLAGDRGSTLSWGARDRTTC